MPVQIKGVGSISGLDQGIVVGIATATNFKTGSSNLHSTGLTVGNALVHSTGINVGTGATVHCPSTNSLTFGTNSHERVRIDSSGRVLIGTNSINGPYDGITPHILLEGTSYDTTTLTLFCNANTVGASPQLQLGKSRGTSDGSTTIVQNNDRLGSIWIVGADGTDRNSSFAALDFFVDGAPAANNTPGRIVFKTTSSGNANPSEKMHITSGGQVNIGGDYTQTSYNLSVTNTGGNLFRIKTANEGDYDLRFMIQNSEANIWHYGTDDLVFGNRYDRKLHLLTNGSKRLTVNGDLVGINNTSPAKNLHVTASSVATVRIETLDSRGQAWDLLSTNGAGTNTGTLSIRNEAGSSYLDLAANGGSPKTVFRNGGANDLLVVDNNGNVTKPRNAFAIIHTNSGDAGASNNKIKDAYAVFTGVHLNQGSHYNTSTGRFTCPVDGVYGVAFSSNCNMSSMSVGNSFNIQTRKNGTNQLYNYNTVFTTAWQQMTFTNYVNCNANDWLALYFSGSNVWGADQGSGQWGEVYFWLAQ